MDILEWTVGLKEQLVMLSQPLYSINEKKKISTDKVGTYRKDTRLIPF